MNWLASIVKGLFGSLWEHFQTQAEKPKPITSADTPPEKLTAWKDRIAEMKRKLDEQKK